MNDRRSVLPLANRCHQIARISIFYFQKESSSSSGHNCMADKMHDTFDWNYSLFLSIAYCADSCKCIAPKHPASIFMLYAQLSDITRRDSCMHRLALYSPYSSLLLFATQMRFETMQNLIRQSIRIIRWITGNSPIILFHIALQWNCVIVTASADDD